MTNMESNVLNKPQYYIGLMSGTSADGIDLALVSFDQKHQLKHHASYYQSYPNDIAIKIQLLYQPNANEIDRAFSLDVELAIIFSHAINAFLAQEKLSCADIIAIGNHGQTIRHRPQVNNPFTLQIGCCQTLATLTNIRVVGQFRRKDMALGGQGAPLVPAFHQTVFGEYGANNASNEQSTDVFVVNIGGIANLTFLPGFTQQVLGYDTGPGNALMDEWFALHHPNSQKNYDKNGHWATTGTVNTVLLEYLLSDSYFKRKAPKSTGREYFHLQWLQKQLHQVASLSPQDVQATLCALTAVTIVAAICDTTQQQKNDQNHTKIYLCGGGVHNKALTTMLNARLKVTNKHYTLLLTNEKGINSDQVEAIAFAWLAFAFDNTLLSSMSTVTGASKCCTLGTAYFP